MYSDHHAMQSSYCKHTINMSLFFFVMNSSVVKLYMKTKRRSNRTGWAGVAVNVIEICYELSMTTSTRDQCKPVSCSCIHHL